MPTVPSCFADSSITTAPGPAHGWAQVPALLLAAGGKVLNSDGEPLCYGKRDRGFDNPGSSIPQIRYA